MRPEAEKGELGRFCSRVTIGRGRPNHTATIARAPKTLLAKTVVASWSGDAR
jgi:hypothetical protein